MSNFHLTLSDPSVVDLSNIATALRLKFTWELNLNSPEYLEGLEDHARDQVVLAAKALLAAVPADVPKCFSDLRTALGNLDHLTAERQKDDRGGLDQAKIYSIETAGCLLRKFPDGNMAFSLPSVKVTARRGPAKGKTRYRSFSKLSGDLHERLVEMCRSHNDISKYLGTIGYLPGAEEGKLPAGAGDGLGDLYES